MKTPSPMEKQAANLYTRKIFAKFQDELVETFVYTANKIEGDGAISTFRVAKFEDDDKAYIVTLNVRNESKLRRNYIYMWAAHIPVIRATQSFGVTCQVSPPTRAEITDVANGRRTLAEKLNMTYDEAERWIVNLVRNSKLDAKIDSKLGTVVMEPNHVNVLLKTPRHSLCVLTNTLNLILESAQVQTRQIRCRGLRKFLESSKELL
ncbi:hypothetical protein IFM89_032744 [Coptis chinensis]|uniref:PCI domain-containing protein n=1 Tax=Coptis chinensis TaxID=261450 RepID=A0A835HGR9_9MAGN|nr:hypothetical protein IFM89_032744 [Coptis chinensis]